MTTSLYARFAQSWRTVPAILLLAIVVRLAFIALFPIDPGSDSAWYMDRAREMAAGMGYQEAGHPTAFWPVGYPALVALGMTVFGPSLFWPILLNLIASAAILWLILWFARAVGLGEGTARVAALIYALYPAHIVYAGITLSELPTTALAMAGMALLLWARGRIVPTLAAGVLLGLATLMRPQILLFAPAVIGLMWLALPDFRWRRAIATGLLTYAALALVVAPWSIRNTLVFGTPVMVSTNGGIALQAGANDLAGGGYFQVEKSPLWEQTGIDFADRVERQVEMNARLKEMAVEWIVENPVDWTLLGFRKMAILWATDGDAFWALDEDHPRLASAWTGLKLFNHAYYLAILGLGALGIAAGARATWRREDRLAPLLVVGAMPIFCTVLAFGFTGQTRYHFSAMPFLCVAAAYTLARIAAARSRPVPLPAAQSI